MHWLATAYSGTSRGLGEVHTGRPTDFLPYAIPLPSSLPQDPPAQVSVVHNNQPSGMYPGMDHRAIDELFPVANLHS